MKLHHLLAASCAITSSAVYANSTPSAIIQELAQSSATATATPEQRLAAFPSLADIPQSATIVIAAGDWRQCAKAVMTHPSLAPAMKESETNVEEVLAQIPDVTSFAFGMDSSIEPSFAALNSLSNSGYMTMLTQAWAAASSDNDLIKSMGEKLATQMMEGTTLAIPTMHMSVSFAEGSMYTAVIEENIKMTLNQVLTAATPEEKEQLGLTTQDIPGGFIVSLEMNYMLDAIMMNMQTMAMQDTKPIVDAMAALRGKKVYFAFSREGNRLRLAMADDIAKLTFPQAAAESVAASSVLDFSNEEITKNPVFLGTFGVSDELTEQSLNSMLQLSKGVGSILTELAKKNANNAPILDKGASSLASLTGIYEQIVKTYSYSKGDVIVWADGSLNMEMTTNSKAVTPAGKLVGMAQADQSSTALYAEVAGCAGCAGSGAEVTFDGIFDSVISVTEAVVLTLNSEMRSEIMPVLQMGKVFIPDVKQLAGNLGTALSGMDAPAGLIMDNKGMTTNFAGGEAEQMPIPRLTLFTGVSDRAKVAQGWADTLTTAKSFLTKIGQDAGMVDLIATVESEKDGVTLHSPSMPVFPAGLIPHIAISDKFWMLGSDSAYSVELQKGFQASAGTPFTGAVFAMNFAPIGEYTLAIIDPQVTKFSKSEAKNVEEVAKPMIKAITESFSGIYAVSTTDGGKQVVRVRLQAK